MGRAGILGGWDTPIQLGLGSVSTTFPVSRSLGQNPPEFAREHGQGGSIPVSSVLFWCAFLVGCMSVWTIPGRARSCLVPVSVPLPSFPCLCVDSSALLGFTWGPCFHAFCVLFFFFFFSFFPSFAFLLLVLSEDDAFIAKLPAFERRSETPAGTVRAGSFLSTPPPERHPPLAAPCMTVSQ